MTFIHARRSQTAAMLVAALSILAIFATEPDLFPTVPPGPILLVVAAGLVALVRRSWTVLTGVAIATFILLGGVVSSGLADNLDHGPVVVISTVVQVAALVTAIGFGLIGLTGAGRPRRTRTS